MFFLQRHFRQELWILKHQLVVFGVQIKFLLPRTIRAWDKKATNYYFFLIFRVQETDGSYFESFTALSWKQENRRLGALRAGEARAELPPSLETALGLPRRNEDIPSHEKENLYVEVSVLLSITMRWRLFHYFLLV